MSNTEIPQPPDGLSDAGTALWERVNREFVLEPDNLILLDHACRCADRVAEASKAIEADGLVVRDRWEQVKANPATELELKYRRLLKGLLRDMGLHVAAAEEYSRPDRITKGPTKGR